MLTCLGLSSLIHYCLLLLLLLLLLDLSVRHVDWPHFLWTRHWYARKLELVFGFSCLFSRVKLPSSLTLLLVRLYFVQSMCVPVYICECAPEHVRGQLGTLWQMAVTIGILVASAANLGLEKWDQGWRLSYGGNILFALILLVCLMFMPESPRWLAAHGTDEQLMAALKKVHYPEEREAEAKKLKLEVQEEKEHGDASWTEVFHKDNHVLLDMSFQAFQQV